MTATARTDSRKLRARLEAGRESASRTGSHWRVRAGWGLDFSASRLLSFRPSPPQSAPRAQVCCNFGEHGVTVPIVASVECARVVSPSALYVVTPGW